MTEKDNPNYDWDNDAIRSLVPDAQYARVSGVMNWSKDNSASCPTDDEISKEVEKLKAAYATQAYARTRKPLYPDIGDQLDDLFKQGAFSADMAAKIKKVKDDNPKG